MQAGHLPSSDGAQPSLTAFDFVNRPAGYIYIGAYVLALVGPLVYLAYARRGTRAG